MKKTFKGYSALIALLIALLVVTAMPMMAFADAGDDANNGQVKTSDGSYFDKDGKLVIPGDATPHTVTRQPDNLQLNLPTCTEAGWVDYKCSTCQPDPDGDADYVIHRVKVAATGHAWASEVDPANWKAKVQEFASCTEDGIAVDYCLNDESHTRELPALTVVALGHKYNKDTTVFTFTDNDKYVDLVKGLADYEANKDLYNKTYKFFIDSYPTCSTDGKAHFICERCGKEAPIAIKKTPGKNHAWSDWKVIKDATCDEKGLEWRRCTLCNEGREEKQTKELDADWQYKDIKVGAGCFEATGTKYCALCAKNGTKAHQEQKNVAIPDYESHDIKEDAAHLYFGPAISTKNVTIKSAAERNVKAVTDKNGNITGYSIIDCNKGYTLVYACSKYLKGNQTAEHEDSSHAFIIKTNSAPGHDWSAWEKNKEGVYTKDGKEFEAWYRTCSRCNNTETWLFDVGVDPNGKNAQDTLVKNTYEITDVAVTDGVGTVKVKQTDGNQVETIYARITWVYELSDGSTFAYAAMADVKDGTVKVGGAMTPNGATLVETQIALTDDPDANLSGEFNQLDGVKT